MAMTVFARDPEGIVTAFGGADVTASDVPPAVPVGEILSVPQPGERRPLMLLSVPFDAGRQAAKNAVDLAWRSGNPPPLLFRFLNDMIWRYGAVEAAPMATTPAVAELEDRSDRYTAGLLDHSAFAGWFWQAPALYDAAEKLGLKQTLSTRSAAVAQLAEDAFSAADVASYVRRLLANANWLRLAGQNQAAALAQAAYTQLLAVPPVESPFVRRLIGIGLDIAAINLRSGYDLRQET
jgi:hypothetical protein